MSSLSVIPALLCSIARAVDGPRVASQAASQALNLRARVPVPASIANLPGFGHAAGILLFDDVEELDLAGPWEVLTVASCDL